MKNQALRELQRKSHAPPLWESRDIVVVSGGQDGLSKALEAIIGPGDPVLVQDPFYTGAEVVVSIERITSKRRNFLNVHLQQFFVQCI